MVCLDSQHLLGVALDRLGSASSPFSMGKLASHVHLCVPSTEEQEPELGMEISGLLWVWKLIFLLWECSYMLIYDLHNATSLGAKDFTIVILRASQMA